MHITQEPQLEFDALKNTLSFVAKARSKPNMDQADFIFRTRVPLPHYPFRLDHRAAGLCLGSCFAESMGQRLAAAKFPVGINPFGPLYQPNVLAQALHRLAQAQPYTADELFFHQEVWRHFDFHSRYAHPLPHEALAQMNESLAQGHAQLAQSHYLLLTLGTAWVYELEGQDGPVANCHKLPGHYFRHRRLTVADCVESLAGAIVAARVQQPQLKVIISVSPVRYLREGLTENQRSKGILMLAAEALCQQLPEVWYFPAYEMVLDELRDYRFFAEDMSHPSSLATDYIWAGFASAFFDQPTQALSRQLQALKQAAAHRPFFAETPAHQAFVKKQLQLLEQLQQAHPYLDLEPEYQAFARQLAPKPSPDISVNQ